MDILQGLSEGEIRRQLTIRQRIIFEGAVYHITQRAPGTERIFLEENDYLYFLKILKDIAQEFHVKLFSFTLLTNHLHLLLQITQKNLSSAMKNLFERYAMYFNEKYQRKGHVFCGRFRASLCNDDAYFLAISVYIHLNPCRAGLCKDFRSYRWSSIRLFTDITAATFVDYQQILSMIDQDIHRARQKYQQILSDSLLHIESCGISGTLSLKRVAGQIGEVIQKITKRHEEKNLEAMVEKIKSKQRMRKIEERDARKYAIGQLLANGYTPAEIEKMLGISRATFYRTIA
ncbi:hypothetical protein BU251_08390 [Candidatus Velamenicoccus archaeovorus]|uniref:Transposase IS200-like domain-containing protein n=1 Tax=Velamenicoccus archaeovorus TaxID=1930593 RepID=A0A410P6B1_VELA1|nr:transposase [Candidatus Velamenicoccus archaeovorus]QAT17736.1 hypothetical protein BU251_08390 [Candidatus Velamenicoccus archaeovorus]